MLLLVVLTLLIGHQKSLSITVVEHNDSSYWPIGQSFGVVSGVGGRMDVLDRVHVPQGEGAVLGFVVSIGFNGVLQSHLGRLRCHPSQQRMHSPASYAVTHEADETNHRSATCVLYVKLCCPIPSPFPPKKEFVPSPTEGINPQSSH